MEGRGRGLPQYQKVYRESVPAAIGHIEMLVRMQAAARVGGNLDDAVKQAIEVSEELANLIEAHPEDVPVLRLQAAVLGNLEKNPGAAERVLERITRIAPRDAGAWGQLGSFYLDGQRIEDGIRCFERAIAIDSTNPLYRAGLARGYATANRQADAEQAFALALGTARPEVSPQVFLWYGDFLTAAARYEESAKAYSRVIATDPLDHAAWLKRAAAEAKAGRYREAEQDSREALARGAGERESQSLLVTVYRGLGDEAKAQSAAVAVERASDAEEERRAKWQHARAALEKADRLLKAERFSEALPLYNAVTDEVPGYADAWFSAGMCYARTADAKHAEQAFRSYLRLQPNSADGHTSLGLLLLMQKRNVEARGELEQALRLDPSSTEARDALNSLAVQP